MNNFDLMTRTGAQNKARGGTEQMQERIYGAVDRGILERFQIWFSRFDPAQFNSSKLQILYCHDLPGDPMYEESLSTEGRKKFVKICFVSNWQMQMFISHYQLSWSQCYVLKNAIEPIPRRVLAQNSFSNKIRLIYHTTPHRGLEILAHVFGELCIKYPIYLDVFSSYEVYGQPERDLAFNDLFEFLKNHPSINYHGAQSNSVVRDALSEAHIFGYPSIWPETSCISLMEAMSAGVVAIHPNFGALYETAAGTTVMYQMQDNRREHATIFKRNLEAVVKNLLEQGDTFKFCNQAQSYANKHYNWDQRKDHWNDFLSSLIR